MNTKGSLGGLLYRASTFSLLFPFDSHGLRRKDRLQPGSLV
jgi:hypothetical protein